MDRFLVVKCLKSRQKSLEVDFRCVQVKVSVFLDWSNDAKRWSHPKWDTKWKERLDSADLARNQLRKTMQLRLMQFSEGSETTYEGLCRPSCQLFLCSLCVCGSSWSYRSRPSWAKLLESSSGLCSWGVGCFRSFTQGFIFCSKGYSGAI